MMAKLGNKVFGLLALFPTMVAAEFTPPEGCTAYMTVQSKQCTVTHYYKCEQDPEGYQWRVDIDQRGPYFLSQIDYETQWVFSIDLTDGTQDRLALGAKNPASFTELLETKRNDFDFTTITNEGEETNVIGYDRLTGKTVEIDGVTLLETENAVEATDGEGVFKWGASGQEYISPEYRTFLSGKTNWKTPDGDSTVDGSPIEFIFPGEAGFLSDEPKYDCNTEEAMLRFEGDNHDKL